MLFEMQTSTTKFAGEKWYKTLLADMRGIVKRESMARQRFEHRMGRRILQAATENTEQGKDRLANAGDRREKDWWTRNKDWWTGPLNELMDQLNMDLCDLRVPEVSLYDAVVFAEAYPTWQDFANKTFKVYDTDDEGYRMKEVKGKDMRWRQVERTVLYPRKPKPKPPEGGPTERDFCTLGGDSCAGGIQVVKVTEVSQVCAFHKPVLLSLMSDDDGVVP